VHHKAESSKRTPAFNTSRETGAGDEVYPLSRDGEQKARLLVIGRENAAAIGVHGCWHDVSVRGLSELLIGKVQRYMDAREVEPTLIPNLKHAAECEVY
jgi:hypothetical protein